MGALYLLSLPFVSAFNVSQIFVIPLIVCLLAMFWYGATGRITHIFLIQADKIILLFLGSILLSIVVNIDTISGTGINHSIAMLGGFIIFYYGAECIIRAIDLTRILRLLYISYMICIFFGAIEFILTNFTSIEIGNYVFRPAITDYTPGFLSIVFIRARSTFEESGYFAAYLGVLFPLMTYYLWANAAPRAQKIRFIGMTLIGAFIGFSVSLFIFLPAAAMLALALRTLYAQKLTKEAVLIFLALLLAGLALLAFPSLVEEVFLRKFSGNSFADRYQRFESTIDITSTASALHAFLGYGPGSYVNFNTSAAVSVYLNFLRDIGIVGLGLYIMLLGYMVFNLLRCQDAFSGALLVSFLVQILFFVSTPIYFQPHYYLIFVFYKRNFIQGGLSTEVEELLILPPPGAR